jgi:NADPH:quinone reductase-like Zn-dependent oxidoreductase
VVNAALAVPLPEIISFEAATALMIQGLTALYLVQQVPPKDKVVLINAAAGGVGSLLVQLARRTRTAIRTSPLPGVGVGFSMTSRTSGPPKRLN